MGLKHKIVFISMILITILCISSVSVVSASSFDNNLTDNALTEHVNLERSSQSVNTPDEIDPINEPIEIKKIDSAKESEINDMGSINAPMEIKGNPVDLKMQDTTSDSNILTDDNDEEEPDVPDLNVDEGSDDINYVYPSNIKKYFQNGVLKSEYKNKTLIFTGDFEGLGKLTINQPYVNITGFNA
jgi:hypothetical protein